MVKMIFFSSKPGNMMLHVNIFICDKVLQLNVACVIFYHGLT